MVHLMINTLNIKVMEIKLHQLSSILKRLNRFWQNVIDKVKKSDEWKIQLTMKVRFLSSKDNDHEKSINSKSNNMEIMIGNEPMK